MTMTQMGNGFLEVCKLCMYLFQIFQLCLQVIIVIRNEQLAKRTPLTVFSFFKHLMFIKVFVTDFVIL